MDAVKHEDWENRKQANAEKQFQPLAESQEKFIDFVNAVDSMINNYLSKEYIGVGCLTELEHGKAGLNQYKNLISQNNRKK